MAVQQTSRVHALPKGACSAPERLLLYILSDFAWKDGSHVFPGKSLLAARAGHSVRWVQMVKARLVARGWLVVDRQGGGRLRTRYRLAIPDLSQAPRAQFSTGFPHSMHRGDRSITGRGDRSDTPGVIDRSHHRTTKAAAASAACPVENPPIRQVPVSTDQPSSTERAHEEQKEDARLTAIGHLRMLRSKGLPEQPRRRRRA